MKALFWAKVKLAAAVAAAVLVAGAAVPTTVYIVRGAVSGGPEVAPPATKPPVATAAPALDPAWTAKANLIVEGRFQLANEHPGTGPGWPLGDDRTRGNIPWGEVLVARVLKDERTVKNQVGGKDELEAGRVPIYRISIIAVMDEHKLNGAAGVYYLCDTQPWGHDIIRFQPAGALPTATKPPSATPAVAWGEAVNGLQAGLSAVKPKFAADEPIPLALHLRNNRKEKLVVPWNFCCWWFGWGLTFTPDGGAPLRAYLRWKMPKIKPPPDTVLAPGEEKALGNWSYLLTQLRFAPLNDAAGDVPLPPGRCTVQGVFFPEGWGASQEFLPISTGSVVIEIPPAGASATKPPAASATPSPAPAAGFTHVRIFSQPKGWGLAQKRVTPDGIITGAHMSGGPDAVRIYEESTHLTAADLEALKRLVAQARRERTVGDAMPDQAVEGSLYVEIFYPDGPTPTFRAAWEAKFASPTIQAIWDLLVKYRVGAWGGDFDPERAPPATKPPAASPKPPATKAPSPPPSPGGSRAAWGAAVNGLQIGLFVEPRRLSGAAPLPFSVRARNAGTKPLTLSGAGSWHYGFGSSVYGAGLAPENGRRRWPTMPDLTLVPGEEQVVPGTMGSDSGADWCFYNESLNAPDLHPLDALPPGRYSVSVGYDTAGARLAAGAWHGAVSSGVVEIEVVAAAAPAPPPAASPKPALDEAAARALASRLADAEFARQGLPSRDRPARIAPEQWMEPRQATGRWELAFGMPAGPNANVSFNLDGSDPQVKVGFAMR